MPAPVRIISRLDIKGKNVIKGVHLEGLRIVGDPADLAAQYYAGVADEIIYMDAVATLYGRNGILETVQAAAGRIFIPMTVGGGIRTLNDIVAALRCGADKVAINTQAIASPDFIREASQTFGTQCITLSVEAKRREAGRWEALTDNGREKTGMDVVDWVQRAEELGAGEILLTSVDMEGTQKGFDTKLVHRVREVTSIPVIASGGAGGVEDCLNLVRESNCDAVALSSCLHYGVSTIMEIKRHFMKAGIPVRPGSNATELETQ
jgi:imidazole glycerol-phosphate synthase subunit HisF